MWSRGLQDDYYFTLGNSLLVCNFADQFVDPAANEPVNVERSARRLARNAELTREALRMVGSRYVFALQPILAESRKPRSLREQRWARRNPQASLTEHYLAYRMVLSALPSLDLVHVFDDQPVEADIFIDGCHFGDRGNAIIASALARHVRAWLMQP
jgi:hypothetical protein